MLELPYSAHIACGGLFVTRFLYCQTVPGGRVSCVLVMTGGGGTCGGFPSCIVKYFACVMVSSMFSTLLR